MNYIKLIQAYWAKHRQEPFSGNETLLYWKLMDLFNNAGEKDRWPDSMRFLDSNLCLETGISANTIDKLRKLLIKRDLIVFEPSGKGSRSGGKYTLVNPTTSSRRTSISSSNFEELAGEVTQEEPQQPPQEEPQNLRNSIIYNEPKQANTQTANNSFSVANACEEKILDLEEKKSEKAPTPQSPPPTPVKPIPIPQGKTFGDGELQSQVISFYQSNPEQYPLHIYLPFLRYWTAKKQKGDPNFIGYETWRTMDRWEIENRLNNWYQREIKSTTHGNNSIPRTPSDFLARQRAAEPQTIAEYGDF